MKLWAVTGSENRAEAETPSQPAMLRRWFVLKSQEESDKWGHGTPQHYWTTATNTTACTEAPHQPLLPLDQLHTNHTACTDWIVWGWRNLITSVGDVAPSQRWSRCGRTVGITARGDARHALHTENTPPADQCRPTVYFQGGWVQYLCHTQRRWWWWTVTKMMLCEMEHEGLCRAHVFGLYNFIT